MVIKVGDLFRENVMKKIYKVKEILKVKRNGLDAISYHLIEIDPIYGKTSYFTSKEIIEIQFTKLN